MLLADVRRALRRHAMIPRGSRVLVACSGGPDSTALLLVLARLAPEHGFTVVAASVDHGLRDAASREIDTLAELCERLGVLHLRAAVDVAGARDVAPRTQRSTQAVARTLRYRALFHVALAHDCTRIAVGHTMDDQAETVLQRVLRGAGIAGLAAMRPVRADGVVRPLLAVRRSAVRAFLAATRTSSAHDPSNDDRRYQRVRLRTDVLPRLEREDPRVVEHLAALAEEAAAVSADEAARAAAVASACLLPDADDPCEPDADTAVADPPPRRWRIDATGLAAAPTGVRAAAVGLLLLRILGRPCRARWVQSIVALAAPGGHGEVPLPGWTLRRRRGGERWISVEPGTPVVRPSKLD
ncbi:MAG: tRNA lysidine(34) synthetase TilS [Deltaproteobacteria bacterium]|nr:tRNA lysidine(34) synthetase TilS [Deltaproteobacteria bacterium]